MGKSLKGKELGKGITQRKDGLYQGSFTNKYGKRITFYGKTAREVSEKLNDARYEDKNGKKSIDKCNITLDEWFDIWIVEYKSHIRNTTEINYRMLYEKMSANLGLIKIKLIDRQLLQKTIDDVYPHDTRERCKKLLFDLFESAVKHNIILTNPAESIVVEFKPSEMRPRRMLSDEEIEKLMSVTDDNDIYGMIIILALNTGMRIGEICGLIPDDIDFENKVIHVKRTLIYTGSHNKKQIIDIHPPKTKSGYRDIPITDEAEQILKNGIIRKHKLENSYEPRAGFEKIIFVNNSNKPMYKSNVHRNLKGKCLKCGVSPISTHELRHTFASRCVANGMRPKVLQKIMGHASLSTTMDVYYHVEEDSIYDEMKKCCKNVVVKKNDE